MFWIIVAAAVWIYILLFVRLGGLKRFWTVIIWSVLLAYFLNETFLALGLFSFQDTLYEINGIPLAYLFAAAGKGIIIIRYLPEEKGWQFSYLILFAVVVTAIEFFALERGFLQFMQWAIYQSFIFRLIAYITLAWLSNLTLRKKQSYLYR